MEFSLARTALKVGLKSLSCCSKSTILIPDFVCDVVSHAVKQINVKIITYPITDELEPDWSQLEILQKKEKCDALLMVHYFGQPQSVHKFREFCTTYNLFLIEDNAHGHGGYLDNKPLGTFGDIGISSPRKILGKSNGGVLFINNEKASTAIEVKDLKISSSLDIAGQIKSTVGLSPLVLNRLKGLRNINRNWSDPYGFQEPERDDFLIDSRSSKVIGDSNWVEIAEQRRGLWKKWENFAIKHDFELIYKEVHKESCPWAFPVYTKNLEDRNYWLKWGARHGLPLFTWPALPREIIEKNGDPLNRWKRMLCFQLSNLSLFGRHKYE